MKEVQVFDKKSETAKFTRIDDGNTQKTINLKLKEEAKKGYFGKIDLSGGPQKHIDNRYNSNLMFSNILVSDSIPQLKWKLDNENRMIAGFNCRKAVAVMFDSVYVFAFYTEEITFSGGPQSLNGLPVMILGVTIPRLSTSWIATKVMLNDVDENEIKLPKAKKQFKFYDLKKLIEDRTKDWNSDDEKENKRIQEQKAKQFWSISL